MQASITSPVHQGHLVDLLKTIFLEDMSVNAKLNIKYPNTGSNMEFDIWIPKYNLCFEFQDTYHYTTTWYNQSSQANVSFKDDIKKILAYQNGISLIDVPCWWDSSVQSLLASLHFYRPDIILPSVDSPSYSPIPLNPPPEFFQKNLIPDVGELMLASFPLDITKFNNEITGGEWWMGEKYDGIRCCWNSNDNVVYSRYGRVIIIHESFTKHMPSRFLDGEFWFGRGEFYYTYNLIKNSPHIRWDLIRVVAFDEPEWDLQSLPFEDRYTELMNNLDIKFNLDSTTILAPRIKVESASTLNLFTQNIIEDGGEGVIIRKCGTPYENGRTSNLVKLKVAQCDQEGIVAGVDSDNTVSLKLADGKTLAISADNVQVNTPKKGDVVTFTFERHARKETPVNARIVRVRTDLEWDDVVRNYQLESNQKGFTTKPKQQSNKRMRQFFEKVALAKKLDPLLSTTWYTIHEQAIRKYKRGRLILKRFKGSYFDTLKHYFPEVPLERAKLESSAQNDIRKSRKFFEEYARQHGLDPLNPESWYFITRKQLSESKNGKTILMTHGGNYFQTLQHLFPEIGLNKRSFTLHSNWSNVGNRRKFFEMYARQHGFDPLVPHHWYKVSRDDILAFKGGSGVLFHYRSFPRALISLFPDIGLDKTKFQYKTVWHNKENRRAFFESVAGDNEMDPLISSNWYPLSIQEKILQTKGCSRVLWYHDNSVATALSDLFPNIGIDASRFERSLWHSLERRKSFFDSFAKKMNFSPRDAHGWHTHSSEIMSSDGILAVLSHHSFNLSKALLDMYPNIGLRQSLLKYNVWTDLSNRRVFFGNYANDNQFDPLIANNWYLHKDLILNTKGIKGVLMHYGQSLSTALLSIFPNINLDPQKMEAASVYSDAASRRKFFEEYAKSNNFDPNNPENWYSHPRASILAATGAQKVLLYHNYNITQALLELFPEIGLKLTRFQQPSWVGEDSRRKFFERYAKENKFDPLIADNWYSQPRDKLLASKGARGVLQYHDNSVSQALNDLFPNIGLSKSNFQHSLWRTNASRRKFFEDYAKENGFDPLIPTNWYSESRDKILATKGGRRVVFYHKFSISQALMDLFPEIGLSAQHFERAKWKDTANRRQFFEEYAKRNNFDPLNANMWYLQPIENIMDTRGASRVIAYHKNVSKALIELFPEVNFESQFQLPSLWRDVNNRRIVLVRYAKENEFDPLVPSNWYSQPLDKIRTYKGVIGILCYYKNKLPKALEHLFPGVEASKFRGSMNKRAQ